MKTRNAIAVAVAAVLVLSQAAQATITQFSYNFDSLTPGSVLNAAGGAQDGWSLAQSDWQDCNVTTTDGNSTQVLTGSHDASGITRAISTLTYGSADTAIVQEAWFKNSQQAGGTAMGLTWANVSTKLMLFGQSGDKGYLSTYFRNATGSESYGDTLSSGHWYDMKWVMDFSTTGGKGTLYYRDITNGATSFTQDATLTNVNMDLTPVSGQYTASAVSIRIDGDGGYHFVDNFSVTTVPEPSTILLLAVGATGLLAFAWRKR